MPGHVVFLECYPHIRGGAQATTLALATGLPSRGWTTEVVAPSGGPALDGYRAAGITTTVLAAPPALRRYGGVHTGRERLAAAAALPAWSFRLAGHLRRTNTAILDVVDQRGVVLGAPAAVLARAKGVWHVHTPGPPSRVDRFGRRWARRCIAPSSGAAATLGGGVAVIPPALPPMPSRPRPSFGSNTPRVVTAGRLHPVKGYDVLIDAFATLVTRVPGVSLDLYGDAQAGHEHQARALESRVRELGLQDVVRFRGHQPCPWTSWDGAAAYVQPSRVEPFGMALIEAMACGLPAIATRVDGPSEIIDDERTGVLVAPEDPDALARSLERVLRDPAWARTIAEAGEAHVRNTYTVDHLLDRTVEVYEAALA